MMYYAINFFMNRFKGNPTQSTAPTVDSEGNPIQIPISQHPHANLWKQNSPYNIK